jgi:hypothetical protein
MVFFLYDKTANIALSQTAGTANGLLVRAACLAWEIT